MKYICLGYYDEKAWEKMSESEINTFMDECFAYDDELRKNGHFIGGEALQSARSATTLRWQNGKVLITDGPFAETKEQLGGIFVLEARDLNHAIQLMSKHPGVKAGPFEIRSAADLSAMVAESESLRSKKHGVMKKITLDELLQELEQEAHATRRVLERVSEDHLGWRPHEKSMTLGQLSMHVANLPGAIAEVALLPSFDIKTQVPLPSATSVAELVVTLEQSVAKARALLSGMDETMLASTWRMVDGEREIFGIPRAAFLRSVMLNHWYHHRGQLTVYLRQTGALVPAVYGPSADDNPFAEAAQTWAKETLSHCRTTMGRGQHSGYST